MSRPAFNFLLGVAGPSRWSVSARQLHTGFCNTAHRANLASRNPSVFLPVSRNTHISIPMRFASTGAEQRPESPKASSTVSNGPRATHPESRPLRNPRHAAERKGGSGRTEAPLGFRAPTNNWPWVPMKSRVQGTNAEQRVIFSRPYENTTFGPGVWLLVVLWTGALMMTGMSITWWYVTVLYPEESGLKDSGALGKTSIWLTTIACGPLVIAILAAMCVMTSKQWATITRLSQVRVKPAPGQPGETTQFIRLVHALHPLGLGMTPRYRDVPLDWIQVRSLSDLRVKLTINQPGKPSQAYIIPLNETKYTEETKEPVVMSLQRLFMTFGAIRPATKEELQVELDNSLVYRIFDRVFGYNRSEGSTTK